MPLLLRIFPGDSQMLYITNSVYLMQSFIISGPTNDVFSVELFTTTMNRTVTCTLGQQGQGLGVFSCQLCIYLRDNSTSCYNLEDSGALNAANAALSNLANGQYYYRVTALIDQAPVGSIFDFFSTCKHSITGLFSKQCL